VAFARLGEIVQALGGELQGDPATEIERIAPLETAGPGEIAFLAQPRLRPLLEACRASAVIVSPALAEAVPAGCARWIVADPYLHFARLTQWWLRRMQPPPAGGVHASAVVEPGARIATTASVGPLAYIGAGALIGEGVRVGAHTIVGERAEIGTASLLHPRVTIAAGCVLGQRNVLQSGAVIGGDGFGFAPQEGQWVKIEQLGAVRTGDDVDIGANTCIDRGALADTVIGPGVKLDNLIQIAHNVHIGAHTAMAGCVGVAGSTRIGAYCTFGGAAMVLGHLEIADRVHISAATVVSRSIRQSGQYTGFFPLDENANWEKNAATLRSLHALRDRVRALEKKS